VIRPCFVFLLAVGGCFLIPGPATPEGTWTGTCDLVIEVPEIDFYGEFVYDFQLDVTVDGSLAAALEVAAEPRDDGTWYTARYDGTWVPPLLTLEDDADQIYELILSDDLLTGDYAWEGDPDILQAGDCDLVRAEVP
jgi:hypothetical protein